MPWVLGNAPIRDEIVEGMISHELLTDEGEGAKRPSGYVQRFRATDRLHAFVKLLEETPLPVQLWIDPRQMPKATTDSALSGD